MIPRTLSPFGIFEQIFGEMLLFALLDWLSLVANPTFGGDDCGIS